MTYSLDEIKQDLYRVLNAPSVTREEVLHLLAEIRAGHIVGNHYIDWASDLPLCGCLVGTIALHRGIEDDEGLDESVLGFFVFPENPIEYYVATVEYGDTPDTNERLANVAHWMEAWLREEGVSL